MNMGKKTLIDSIAKRADMKNTHIDENGDLVCNICGEKRVDYIPEMGKCLPVECSCKRKEAEADRLNEEAAKAKRMRNISPFYIPGLDACTFSADDTPNSEASRLCRSYAEHWAEIEKEGFGFILSGSLGVGKSYLAACIVNALIAQGVPAIMTSAARFVNVVQASKNPAEAHDELNRFQLVVMDDIGAERSTDYAAEQVESFIDARMLVKKPLIVTTNLSGKDLASIGSTRYARAFDRLKIACPKLITMTGESRRNIECRQRKQQLDAILNSR